MAKKIGAIISLIIIGFVIVAAIVLVNIDIKYNVECVKPDIIWVQTPNDQHLATDEQKNKIVDFINNASKQNALVALFDGELGKKEELVTSKATLTKPKNFYVRYKYNTKQELIVDGKEFKEADGSVVKYEELVFVVTDLKDEVQVRVYVMLDSDEANVYSYYYNVDANFEDLFDYLTEEFV